MSFGERAALEGLLSELRPGLAIELGTAQGGSLSRIASHSTEVHTFDLLAPSLDRSNFTNVAFHVGDSHQLLPEVLESLAQRGKNVDFVLVDGDHSADGVRQDLEDLLRSPALARSVILMHDTVNETVRAGIERAHLEAYPKLAYLELDFVGGYIFREPSLRHELWGGLGLAIVDASRKAYFSGSARQARYYEAGSFLPEIRDLIARSEREEAVESS
jgi:Methyltransferase domain